MNPKLSDEVGRLKKQIELLNLLGKNASKISRRLQPVIVAIPDSGLYGDKIQTLGIVASYNGARNRPELPFSPDLMAGGDPNVDGRMLAAHGTAVASIAKGGPMLESLIEALGYDLVLRPFNVFDVTDSEYCKNESGQMVACRKAKLKPDKLYNKISTPMGAIWNLSIGQEGNSNDGTMKPLLDIISDIRSNELFVVAAGNSGVALSSKAIYPAFYGGRTGESRNIVTVGALNFDGGVANFSSFGTNVDIAAPGCEIEASVGGSKTENWTGTSFAAPSVSFVAAILKSYSSGQNWSVQDIKHRILTSADYDESISSKVNWGRKLNVQKALSIFEDVTSIGVERKLLHGEFLGDLSEFKCEGNIQLNRSICEANCLKQSSSKWHCHSDGISRAGIHDRTNFSILCHACK